MSKIDSNDDVKPSRELFVNELKHQNEREWEIRKNLDDKAARLITISGAVASLIFGFGTFLIQSKPELPFEILIYVKLILILNVILNSLSIFLSVWAFKLRNLAVPFGHTMFYDEKEKEKRDESMIEEYKSASLKIFRNTMIEIYLECIRLNSDENESKAFKITIAYWSFFIGMVLITVLLILLFSHIPQYTHTSILKFV